MKKNYFHIFIITLILSCSQEQTEEKKVNTYYDIAFNSLSENRYNEAFKNFNLAKDIFLKQKDSFGAGKCLINMAILQEQFGDNYGSQETSLSAIKYFDDKDSIQKEYLIANYNSLGMISSKLRENNQAIFFYSKALNYLPPDSIASITKNNIANAYRRERRYSKAINIYTDILKEKISKKEYSRIFSNLAYTKWLRNPNYNAIPEIIKALNIRIKEQDKWGLNASYSHLTDYYTRKKPDSALFFAKKMHETAKEIESPDDQIEALQKLISLENPENSKQYFKVYQKLNDSLQTARNKAKNQFALIRYETEKNKADFLKAKAESAQRQNYIIKQYILIGFIISVLIFIIISFRRRQKRLQQEKLLEVKNTELKYSKKVHDVVANGLYHTMIEIQNNPELNKENILNRIEKMYEESRDIAQEDILEADFFSRFSKMVNSYNSGQQKVLVVGYKDDFWENISEGVQSELYYIVREMLVNMKKHSLAKLASLKFEKNENNIIIKYTDNGIGINNLENKKGTGIRNTENRIDAINGDLIFEKNPNGGLIIKITVPINSKYV